MSRIDNLIAEQCPNGIKYEPISEVITALRTGLNPRTNFKLNAAGARNYYITVRELGGLSLKPSEKTDLVDGIGLQKIQNRSKLQIGDVLFSGTGTIGRTALVSDYPSNWNIKEGVYALTPQSEIILPRFLIYVLHSSKVRNNILSQADGSTVASISMSTLRKIRIPVPPLEVQQEIVAILDTFSTLEAELEAELEARRQQYEHYRDSLVSKKRFLSNSWVPLSEVATIRTGSKPEVIYPIGGFPYVNAGIEPSGFTDAVNTKGGVLTIPSRGQGGAGHVGYQASDFWCGPLCYRVDSKSPDFTNRFLFYYLKNIQEEIVGLRKIGSIPAVNKSDLGRVIVPAIELDEQLRIVSILDSFDTLVNDLSIGLPAELSARRQQYEYYRDKLLTFEEVLT